MLAVIVEDARRSVALTDLKLATACLMWEILCTEATPPNYSTVHVKGKLITSGFHSLRLDYTFLRVNATNLMCKRNQHNAYKLLT